MRNRCVKNRLFRPDKLRTNLVESVVAAEKKTCIHGNRCYSFFLLMYCSFHRNTSSNEVLFLEPCCSVATPWVAVAMGEKQCVIASLSGPWANVDGGGHCRCGHVLVEWKCSGLGNKQRHCDGGVGGASCGSAGLDSRRAGQYLLI